jgi:hypothetical protein
MKRLTTLCFSFLISVLFVSNSLFAGDLIEFSNEFNLFTSKNLEGYAKPFFTSIEESINSNLFSTAYYKDYWTVGLDISVSGMFIPNSQTYFDAERPEDFGNTSKVRTAERRNGDVMRDYTDENIQPTIYGGRATAIYAARQNAWYPDSMNKTVGYVEGNDISFMSGLPTLQLTLGLPTRTQVRFRFLMLNVSGEPLTYWGVSAAQRLDQFFQTFDPEQRMAYALHLSYAQAIRDAGISMNSFAVGGHFSKSWDFGMTFYAGLQYETMSGTFDAVRDKSDAEDYNDSPYEEIRNMEDIHVDISSFTSFRFLGGVSYQIGFLELHVDAAWASQPILTAGISFTFGRWGNSWDLEKERQLNKKTKTE